VRGGVKRSIFELKIETLIGRRNSNNAGGGGRRLCCGKMWKAKLPPSKPRRHIGGAEVWLHSFLTLTLEGGQLHAPAALPPENNPVDPREGLVDFQNTLLPL